HYDMAEAFKSVTKWVGKVDRADLVPDYVRRAFTQLRSGRPGPVLLIIPRDLGESDEDEHPYSPVKGWRSGPDPDDVKAALRVPRPPPVQPGDSRSRQENHHPVHGRHPRHQAQLRDAPRRDRRRQAHAAGPAR